MTKMSNVLAALGVVAALGVAALPLSSYAAPIADGGVGDLASADGAVATNVGVTLEIADELTIAANKDTTSKVDLSGDGHTGDVTLTVVTNNQKGYNLAIKGSANQNATSLTSGNGDQIVAGSGTVSNGVATPAVLSTTTSEWGYRLSGWAEGYVGVTTSDDIIHTANTPTGKDGEETVVTFAASIKDGQPAGIYDGEVTFTATNNAITPAE